MVNNKNFFGSHVPLFRSHRVEKVNKNKKNTAFQVEVYTYYGFIRMDGVKGQL